MATAAFGFGNKGLMNPVSTAISWGERAWPPESPCVHNTPADMTKMRLLVLQGQEVSEPVKPCPYEQAINKYEAATSALTFSGDGAQVAPPPIIGCTFLPKDMVQQWGIRLPFPILLDDIVTTAEDGTRRVSLELLRAVAPELADMCVCNWVQGPTVRLAPVSSSSHGSRIPQPIITVPENCVAKPAGQAYTLDLLVFAVAQQYVCWLNAATAELHRTTGELQQRTGLSRRIITPQTFLVAIGKHHYALGVFAWMAHVKTSYLPQPEAPRRPIRV
ncbi:hypothetical protein C2E23DRAFT_862946 [Lenzites betulinus]|nr:hypothetical protein C2E23DRAFT_862946 [Lenzites betulinus]